jgi:hypothetical protein
VTFRPPDVPKQGKAAEYKGCFTAKMEAFIEANAKNLGVTHDGIIGGILANCSGAISADCMIDMGGEFIQKPTVWVLIIGESGTKKTDVFKIGQRFFKDKQNQLREKYEAEMKAYRVDKNQYDYYMKEWAKKSNSKKETQPKPPDEPIKSVILRNQGTIEGLLKRCSQNPRGIAYFRDEISPLIRKLTSKDGENEIGNWLEAYDGGFTSKETVSGGEIECSCFRLTMFGGIQPDIADDIINDKCVDGFIPRFIMVKNESLGKAHSDIDKSHADYMYSVLNKIYDMNTGTIAPVGETKEYMKEVCDDYNEKGKKIQSSQWRSFICKMAGRYVRITMILHAIDMAEKGMQVIGSVIPLETAKRAKRLCDNFIIPSTRNVYAMTQTYLPDNEGMSFSKDEKDVIKFLKDRYKKGEKTVTANAMRRFCRAYNDMVKKNRDKVMLDMLVLSGICSIQKPRADSIVLTISDYIEEVV